MIEVLNEVFSNIDKLTEKYGVEKIKTMGDGYMVVSGLNDLAQDGVESVAEFALDVVKDVQEYAQLHNIPLAMRVGISTGKVIGGVIGLKKPSFDLWGETVNLASRMETNSGPGQIQVTEATYWRLHEKYDLVARGAIDIEGIGKTEAYFLVGRKET